jgi:hypothetical protein
MFIDENTPDLEQDENNTETEDEQAEDDTSKAPDWEAEAKKAQAQAKKYKAILDRNRGKEEALKPTDGFGLDMKGYLKASGIKATEFDFVREEWKKTGQGDIDALLENEYFQAKLTKHRELSQTADATPKGKGANSVPTDSVEYWSGKPLEEVPPEMRIKVVNARLDKEKNKGVFYNS